MSASKITIGTGKAAPGRLAILYDGGCEMCRTALDGIRTFDNSGLIDAIDLNSEAAREHFPDLTREHLLEELHAVDGHGRVFRGARAINEVLRRQHGWKGLIAYLWYVPGYAWLADRQYKRISSTRHRRDALGRLKKRTVAKAEELSAGPANPTN
ncbi:MAG: thiol-disulfide oxidoreductase DCC family protein [Candidatus Binataceae bacterium]